MRRVEGGGRSPAARRAALETGSPSAAALETGSPSAAALETGSPSAAAIETGSPSAAAIEGSSAPSSLHVHFVDHPQAVEGEVGVHDLDRPAVGNEGRSP